MEPAMIMEALKTAAALITAIPKLRSSKDTVPRKTYDELYAVAMQANDTIVMATREIKELTERLNRLHALYGSADSNFLT